MTCAVAGMAALATGVRPALVVLLQTTSSPAPLPASPPIGGPFWTLVVPALLLLGAATGTILLYRRFAGRE